MKNLNLELLKDKRCCQIIENLYGFISENIVRQIEKQFTNIETFMKFKKSFGIYANKAHLKKLSKDEAITFVLMRKKFNKTFGIENKLIRQINKQFRYEGKIIRVPSDLIDYVLSSKFNIKSIAGGKALKTNYHWTKKYIAKDYQTLVKFWNKYHKEISIENKTINTTSEREFTDEELEELLVD